MLSPFGLVGQPRELERAGLFVAEGRQIVRRLIEDGRFRIHSVAVTPPAAAALASLFERHREIPVHVCEPDALRAITGFDFHRGCLALAWRELPPVPLDRLTHAPRLLALEGVGDPDNVGGLFRTAFALGVDALLLDPATADPYYRKAIRTSMGATLRLPFVRVTPWPSALDRWRDAGSRIVALTPHPSATPLAQVRLAPGDRLVLLAGSEGQGLCDASLRYADLMVRIPVDPRADSLNVVVAAGVALNALRG